MSDIPEFKGDGTCGANLTALMTQFQSGVQELNTRLQNCEKAARYKELLTPEDSELILLRFLIGKGNDVEVAWTAFEKSMEWRDEHKSNLVPDIDDEKYEANVPFGKVIPTYVPELNFNGASKSGLPLAFELKGRIDIHGLIKAVTPEQYSQHLAWSLIASTRKMNKMSREQDKLLATALVMCCKNVSTAHLKYLPYFKYEVDWSQLNCPELLGEAIVVNTPWFFNMIWQIVKPWLDKRTLQKVHILGGKNSERDLQELVDAKYIPVALGGSDPAPKMVIPDPTKGMSKVDLGAGKKHTIELKADKANLTINWKWKPVGRDVGFSVTFIDEEGVDDQVVDYEKFSASGEVYDGSFLTSRAGVMRFEWDNSYSYFTGKTFMYIVGEFEELQLQ